MVVVARSTSMTMATAESAGSPGVKATSIRIARTLPAGRSVPLRQRGLRGGQPRDRHAEWRARDVVQPRLLAEGDGLRVPAVLTADPQLDVRPGASREPRGHLDQAADALTVERLERVSLEHSLLEVGREERALGVVPREGQ